MPRHRKARAKALSLADDYIAKSRIQLKAAFDRYPADSRTEQPIIDATLKFGGCGYAAMSNLSVRRYATETLIKLMLKHHDRQRSKPNVQTFLLTASFDAGFCFEDVPAVNLASIQLSIRRALQTQGLQAVCAFEVDVLAKKLAGEHARRLIFHVHGICWTSDGSFQPVTTANRLSSSRYFTNMLGAPSFTIISRAMAASRGFNRDSDSRFADLAHDQTARSIASMAQYLLKCPIYAKNRHIQADGRTVMRPDGGAFRLKTVLRIAEIWSNISLNKAVFAVGPDADALVRSLKRRVTDWAKKQRTPKNELNSESLKSAWKHFFERNPKIALQPSNIRHRESQTPRNFA